MCIKFGRDTIYTFLKRHKYKNVDRQTHEHHQHSCQGSDEPECENIFYGVRGHATPKN